MTVASERYKRRYEVVFQDDISFSRKFMPQISRILGGLRFFDEKIRDNEGTELNSRGADLTIPAQPAIQVGVRVRRAYAVHYDEFTQDDKERKAQSCDVYFFGYATDDESDLQSYMVWDGKEYQKKRDAGIIPIAARRRNKTHSLVWFNCYRLRAIREHCRIYGESGSIGCRPI